MQCTLEGLCCCAPTISSCPSVQEKALAACSKSVPGQEAPDWYGKREYDVELARLWTSIVAGNVNGIQQAHSTLQSSAREVLSRKMREQHAKQVSP